MTDAELRSAARSFPGTRAELARELGLSERTLYRRLQEPSGPEADAAVPPGPG